LPEDPTRAELPVDLDRWPNDWIRAISAPLKPAGVLIPIIERAPHLTVLLTRRSAELKHHASQISFPGGRMEKHDDDILATALRETHEEVGILASAVRVIGNLEPQPTVTGYAVTAIIGLIEPPVKLAIDRGEVDVAFEVPLSFLMDPHNAKRSVRTYRGYTVPTTEFHFGGHRIWGATANMLVKLRDTVNKQ
jgi:8-oxo-dGTP pyrophosphatase MutT (NUDIX family)